VWHFEGGVPPVLAAGFTCIVYDVWSTNPDGTAQYITCKAVKPA
jgi:hypothetical protein